jgi:hypothetical protein
MADTKFPTEVISLPSKGYFYPEDNPLSSGEIEIKYMTAREEDILTSTNLIQQGLVIDKLLEALVVSKVNLDDMLIGDKNAVMVASRVLAYGKEYKIEFNDANSGRKREEAADLTTFGTKEIDFSKFTKGLNEFEYELITSKRKIIFKFLTQHDENKINSYLKSLKRISKNSNIDADITTRLKHCILSVDGKDDKSYVNNFVDNEFLSIDSLAFRTHLLSVTPDVNMLYYYQSDNGEEESVTVPMTVEFFWPSTSK